MNWKAGLLTTVGAPQRFLCVSHGSGHRFFAPDVFAGHDGLAIQSAVFLHVRGIDQQFKTGTGQHLIERSILVRHLKAVGLLLRAFWNDVADADEFNPWRGGQMRQIHARDAATPNEPDFDFARLPGGGRHQDRRGQGRPRSLQKRPARGMGSRRRRWILNIHE